MLESFLKQFPSLIRASVQFYFSPQRFLSNYRISTPQSILTYFAALSAILIVLNTAHQIFLKRPLFMTPTADLSTKVIYINGKRLDTPAPFVKQVGLLGTHGSVDFRIGAAVVQYIMLPISETTKDICAIGQLENKSKDYTIVPHELDLTLSPYDTTQLALKLLSSTAKVEELARLDFMLRRLMMKICGKNYLYFTGAPGYFVLGVSDDNLHLLNSSWLTSPWSAKALYVSKGSLMLDFGLVHTEIGGVSPKDIDAKIYILLLTSFLVAAGVSIVLGFTRGNRGKLYLLRRGFQLSLAIFIIPFLLFFLLSAVIALFPELEELGACPSNVIVSSVGSNRPTELSCGSVTVLSLAAGAGGLIVLAFCLRYLFALPAHGFSKLQAIGRGFLAVIIFLGICTLILAPLDTFIILNYAELK